MRPGRRNKRTLRLRYAVIECLFLLAGTLVTSCPASGSVKDSLPVKGEVGALRLPDSIAPVTAPFKMPDFKKPVFPSLTINIKEKGARPDVLATKAIQEAIDAVNEKGGGTVLIPPGLWKTGRIVLKSNVNLFLEDGSELHFSGAIEDYQPPVFTRSAGIEGMSLGGCIYANGQKHIAITGKGKLVGPGNNGTIKKQSIGYGSFEEVVPLNKPASERVYDGKNGGKVFLPPMISPVNCKNVYIEGVSLEHSVFWNIVPVYCDGVIIRGVTVNSVGIPSGDGIDISSCKNVLIEYCTLSCGDDCFTIKAGRGIDGLRVDKPSENIVVRYCLALQGMGGITCGSETAGMIRNLYVHDCVFEGTDRGIRLKTRRPRGGGGEDLYFERIRMSLKKEAFAVDMLGSSMYVGKLAGRLPGRKTNKLTPEYKNIVIRDIVVGDAREFIRIRGLPESLFANCLIENAVVNCRKLISIHDAKNITLRNMTIRTPEDQIDLLDVQKIVFDKVHFITPENQIRAKIEGALSDHIRFEDCIPSKPVGWEQAQWEKQK